ncbi:HNH endonuclease [Nocardia tengchongensis]|uniref:HNH endonuclease n=1 Tax=Nocardia tengchongensis TaxID=2055889 RepID=UPI00365B8D65
MSAKIKFRKSVAGQRALMTSKLRTMIKERDRYTCRSCSISLAAEPHLLLEVDHIMPVSRGGLTAPDNLQTLCWRYNRTKSNKVIAN